MGGILGGIMGGILGGWHHVLVASWVASWVGGAILLVPPVPASGLPWCPQACENGRGAILLSVARGKVSEGIDFGELLAERLAQRLAS